MTSEEFYSALRSNEYGQQYLSLIEKVQLENRGTRKEKGYELHHMHPRKLGGDLKDLENLIKLTTFEHCKCHAFLAQAIPCVETLAPIVKMTGRQYLKCSDLERIELNEIERWAELRDRARIYDSENKKGKPGHPCSEETRRKIALKHRGMKHSEEARKKMSEAKRGKPTWRKGKPLSEETKQKLSRANMGNTHARGHVVTPEAKKRMSEIKLGRKSPEWVKRKISESLKGRPAKNKGKGSVWKEGIKKYIDIADIDTYLSQGYFRTRAESLKAIY